MDDVKKTCDCKSCSQIFVDITRGILMFCPSILVLVTALSKPSDSTLALIRGVFEVGARAVSSDTKIIIPPNEAQLIEEQNKKLQEINIHLLRIDIALQNLNAKSKKDNK